jgi:hypothetical protein
MYSRLSIGLMLLIWAGVAETRCVLAFATNAVLSEQGGEHNHRRLAMVHALSATFKGGMEHAARGGCNGVHQRNRSCGGDAYTGELLELQRLMDRPSRIVGEHGLQWFVVYCRRENLIYLGTDIYVYGTRGPQQGGYRVLIDNVIVGDYSAQQASEISFSELLFEAHDLSPEGSHALRMVAGAGRLSIDFAVITESTIEM